VQFEYQHTAPPGKLVHMQLLETLVLDIFALCPQNCWMILRDCQCTHIDRNLSCSAAARNNACLTC
jgi:hypothetical protein